MSPVDKVQYILSIFDVICHVFIVSYFVAFWKLNDYNNLYANNGAATEGVDSDTADGFGEEKIQKIIKALSDETYNPKPVRRTYIAKGNGKQRPLGIPTFTDKLVQEVLRMILEAIYEPVFLDCSHGFRPKRSCHTALQSIKKGFNGARWFIEGDIKGCFDNIEHNTLISLINKKVKDMRIIKLLWKFLKAGYMEDWKYHNTYSGCPQGGIISPLLSNIYLHELDKFAIKFADEFNTPSSRPLTKEYKSIAWKVESIRGKIGKASNEAEKQALLKELKQVRAIMLKTPCKMQDDKKVKYVRYADDFIIAVNGSREDCMAIKRQFADFIADTLKMELSEDKTLITHSNNHARFLGYDVRVRRCDTLKKSGKVSKRTLSNMVELNIPLEDKIMKFLFSKGVISQGKDGKIVPVHRKKLLTCTPLEIVSTYNSELRGICNFYSLASNYPKLHYFSYLMEYSCLKTLASKHKCQTSNIRAMYKNGKGGWGVPYETKKGIKRCYLAKHSDCQNVKNLYDVISNAENMNRLSITTLESRLAAKKCELCGTIEANQYEIHHINKVKNLKGKKHWEKVMIAKKRKTLVVCKPCHYNIHHGNKSTK
jgi:group II intron reverse transcriptase/maturase